MTHIRAVNWHDENLNSFYGDNNQGLVFGIYVYDDPDDFPIDVEWYADEKIRDSIIENLRG